MPSYVELFQKVLDGYGSCNEADGYSECQYCPYDAERAESGEPWPGLEMCSPLKRDIDTLTYAMQKLDDM